MCHIKFILHECEATYILEYRVGEGEVELGEKSAEPVTTIKKVHFII